MPGLEPVEVTAQVARVHEVRTVGIAELEGGVAAEGREQAAAHAGAAEAHVQHRAAAVGAVNALHLLGNEVVSLIPADALPRVLAAQLAVHVLAAAGLPVLALHGVLQALRRAVGGALGAATHAAAVLEGLDGVLVNVVGLDAGGNAVHHIHLQQALAAAGQPALHRLPLAGGILVEFRVQAVLARGRIPRLGHLLLRCATGGQSRGPGTRRRHERAARQRARRVSLLHGSSSLSSRIRGSPAPGYTRIVRPDEANQKRPKNDSSVSSALTLESLVIKRR